MACSRSSRPTATPSSAVRISTSASWTIWRTSFARRPASICATIAWPLQRLKDAAEKAKIELSSTTQTDVNLPFITADQNGPKHLNMKLTRAKLEALVDDLVQRTVGPCKAALKDAGLQPSEINEVVLVGGQTRMPKVQETVQKLFGREPHKGREPGRGGRDRRRHPGRRAAGRRQGRPAARRHAAVARHRDARRRHDQAHRAQHHDPDQAQPDLLDRGRQSDRCYRPRLPGEREMAADNKLLGQFDLIGIPPSPRGLPQIEVTFDIDANGIVNVSAKDKASGREQTIRIQASGGLTEADIQRMVREAEAHAEEDKRRK